MVRDFFDPYPMLKHTQKKFVFSKKLSAEAGNVLRNAPEDELKVQQLIQENFADHFCLVHTEADFIIQAFRFSDGKNNIVIPEPNPIVMYFELARFNYKHISTTKTKLYANLGNPTQTLNHFFHFFQISSIVSTFLFMSIEAFINSKLPLDIVYSRQNHRNTTSFNRSQIQTEISFEEKIKQVLPEFTGKSFASEYGHKYETISRLKKLRDEITHTKGQIGGVPINYQDLYTMALNFNYTNALLHTKDFLNFYEPNLIEECSCSNRSAD
jgi:hypothetical protein